MSNTDKLSKVITYYQQTLEHYAKKKNDAKMLHCIFKLSLLPVTRQHLEETGVGRTVNSLRRLDEVGDAARTLVTKWKEMVSKQEEENEENEEEGEEEVQNIKSESSKESNTKLPHKDCNKSNSSHRNSDKHSDKGEKSSNHKHTKHNEESQVNKTSHTSSSRKDHKERRRSKERKSSDYSEESHSDHSERIHSDNNESDSDRSASSESPDNRMTSESEDEESDAEDKKSKHKEHSRKNSRVEVKKYDKNKNNRSSSEPRSKDKHSHSHSKEKEKHSHKSSRRDRSRSKDKKYDTKPKESDHKLKDKRKNEEKEKTSEKHSKKRKHDNDSSDSDGSHKKRRSSSKPKRSEDDSSDDSDSSQVKERSNDHHNKSLKSDSNKKDDKKKDKHHKKSHKSSSHHSSKSDSKKHSDKDRNKEKSSNKDSTKSERKSDKKSSKHESKPLKVKENIIETENGICSSFGASFADALGMLEPTTSTSKSVKKTKPYTVTSSPEKMKPEKNADKKKSIVDIPIPLLPSKLEPLDIDISSLLPTITPNYRPLGNCIETLQNSRNKILNDDEALSMVMSSKNQRTKVYSGNKCMWSKVPSLFELCTRILQDNIDALEYTGGVPYSILKPVLDKATPDQLFIMEHHNPYLMEDTDELWQLHCQREFRNKHREEMETWREMYMRCLDEREAKLKTLKENIKQSQEKSTPIRKTQLAYVDSTSVVKPPRNILKKQMKNNIDKKPIITPNSRLTALATAGATGLTVVPNPGARASSSGGSSAHIKPKKAPLMQKTLQFLKGGRFRR